MTNGKAAKYASAVNGTVLTYASRNSTHGNVMDRVAATSKVCD